MNEGLDWIADVDSSKVNVLKFIQIMSAKKPGKYLFQLLKKLKMGRLLLLVQGWVIKE